MTFRSIGGKSSSVGFREALFQGIADDGSLFVPSHIPELSKEFFEHPSAPGLHEIAHAVTSLYIEDIPREALKHLLEQALSFPIPLVHLKDNFFLLELFHGPTLAFKDVGARFMAAALSYYLLREKANLTILVATSGDTGSAVAHGFFRVPNISVFVLYPSGKISRLQEQQITTLGENIRAIEVEGSFDDCQHMVKQTLADAEVRAARNLTTANSINLGRLLPQISYYVWAVAELRMLLKAPPLVIVPSGNLGNLTAAVYAKRMGTPIRGLVAATNANVVVPEYFRTGIFAPRPSIQTYSNAMDVGNPNNFARLQSLYGSHPEAMSVDISADSISDLETLEEIRRTHTETGYMLDPHTAVGIAVARRLKLPTDVPVIIPATAHPAKFDETMKTALGVDVPLPGVLQEALRHPKLSTRIPADYGRWKTFLLETP